MRGLGAAKIRTMQGNTAQGTRGAEGDSRWTFRRSASCPNSGFGRAAEMGAGFGIGDDVVNGIFCALWSAGHADP
jgi:hypothetical protein